jgi:hypothetical protein
MIDMKVMSADRGRRILLLDSLPLGGDPLGIGANHRLGRLRGSRSSFGPVIDAPVPSGWVAYPPFGNIQVMQAA